jgi:hypothetical protein
MGIGSAHASIEPTEKQSHVEVGDIMGISDSVKYPISNIVDFDVLP